MTEDIVRRLRTVQPEHRRADLLTEAADEIERLRATIATVHADAANKEQQLRDAIADLSAERVGWRW